MSPEIYLSPPSAIRVRLLTLVASLATPILPREGHLSVLAHLLCGGISAEQLLRAAVPATALGARGSCPSGDSHDLGFLIFFICCSLGTVTVRLCTLDHTTKLHRPWQVVQVNTNCDSGDDSTEAALALGQCCLQSRTLQAPYGGSCNQFDHKTKSVSFCAMQARICPPAQVWSPI